MSSTRKPGRKRSCSALTKTCSSTSVITNAFAAAGIVGTHLSASYAAHSTEAAIQTIKEMLTSNIAVNGIKAFIPEINTTTTIDIMIPALINIDPRIAAFVSNASAYTGPATYGAVFLFGLALTLSASGFINSNLLSIYSLVQGCSVDRMKDKNNHDVDYDYYVPLITQDNDETTIQFTH